MSAVRIGLYYKKELIAEFSEGNDAVSFIENYALGDKLEFYELRFADHEGKGLPERIPNKESMIER